MAKKNKIKINSNSDDNSIRLGDLLGVPFKPLAGKKPLADRKPLAPKKSTSTELPEQGNRQAQNNKNEKKKTWKGKAEIWFSKKGRAGKIASLVNVSGLTHGEQEVLFKALKKQLACGGNIKNGEWIVQSPKREAIKYFLERHGIKCKLCGG